MYFFKLIFVLFLFLTIIPLGYVLFMPMFAFWIGIYEIRTKVSNWINTNLICILLSFSILVCFWAICSIRLNVIPRINTSWHSEFCTNLNDILVNLSYSFLAGYIFYLLTVIIPDYKKKKKIKPILYLRFNACFKRIDRILNKFVDGSGLCYRRNVSREELTAILDSKKWRDIIPRIGISYIEYISLQGKYIRQHVLEMIDLYKDEMSESQIANLEYLIGMLIFSTADEMSAMPNVNLDDPQGKKSLINDFCNMYTKLQEIYKSFEIKEKLYTK